LNTPTALLHPWQFNATAPTESVVLPDGCQDLIFCTDGTGRGQWFVSALADAAYTVASPGGAQFIGYRLQPGTQLDQAALLRAMAHRDGSDVAHALNAIDDFTFVDQGVRQALAALAGTPKVEYAARVCGLSMRSFERLLSRATGQPPSFWKCLARARQAAHALMRTESLAALAADHGYADQAHLQRDFKRWFGVTPMQLRRNTTLLRTATALGYG
jgi:AraC-like DNA-binding protein